uniref:Cyanophycinase n=1 Tax=Aureoumbra lagunensis TaxID=44058 RepID=A0A7S3NKB1_9STRA
MLQLSLFVFLVICQARKEEACNWCSAPAASVCNQNIQVVKEQFWTSISAATNRTYPYWRPLDQPAIDSIQSGLVILVQHGTDRNGDEYTQYMAGAVAKSGLENTYVFGPQMYFLGDTGLDSENELYWDDSENADSNWRWGGDSSALLSERISSFAVLDELVSALGNNQTKIFIAGHSAGGQVVQRFALFSQTHPDLFITANPSSVTYLDARRPLLFSSQRAYCDKECDNVTIAKTQYEFEIPIFKKCVCSATYNNYGYGLNDLNKASMYVANQSISVVRERYLHRSVRYVAGQSDVCNLRFSSCEICQMNDNDLDRSCAAELQGYCRYERLTAFSQYINSTTHALVTIPNVGHNSCGIFQSPEFIHLLKISSLTLFTKSSAYDWYCIPKRAAYCQEDDQEISTPRTKPGTVTMGGGTDVDAAFEWQISRGGSGNFLILRESGTEAYDPYLLGLGAGVAATLILNDRRASEESFVLEKVKKADAIFFAGGDQSKYVSRIKNTSLETLLKSKSINVTIGGTSAGNAIQGLYIYIGAFGSAISDECLQHPYNFRIDLGPALLKSPPLDIARVIMDDHFVTRDRMGRMLTFMARLLQDGLCTAPTVRGIGVDEATALLVDHASGVATLVGNSTAYACEASSPQVCMRGEPLTLKNISCQRLGSGDSFNLYNWNGTGYSYSLDIVRGRMLGEPYGLSNE